MTPPPDEVDPQTAADLARWFSLPSFQDANQFAPPDPTVLEEQKKRSEAAMAAVDPGFCEDVGTRFTGPADRMWFVPRIDVHLDPDVTMVNQALFERQAWLAEQREVFIPPQLEDDLKACAPQALLRDLHRVVTDFEKLLIPPDPTETPPLLAPSEARAAMRERVQVENEHRIELDEARAMIAEGRRDIDSRRWPEWVKTAVLAYRKFSPSEDR